MPRTSRRWWLPGTGEAVTLPVVQDAGARTPALSELLLRAIAVAPRAPRRVDAESTTYRRSTRRAGISLGESGGG
ncbi:hypothetical protein [Streptomyces sp. NPDC048350]|uniref:hypothetical protein n=1 Tax=Streptomyces sp. NPDC048350 TaxID=3365538 RepID=UPI0037144565